MIAPPAGWEAHRYWHDFHVELSARQAGLATACVCLALLVLGRALLPVADRGRVRLTIFFIFTYLVMLFIKAGLLAGGMDSAYATAHLAALVALSWGITGTAGLMTFDLIGHRFRIPKILRDLSVTIASAVAMVMLLSRSGVNLLSIITTSAVLTAVIGLALQDTLGNLLSGVALQLESSIGIGDWIRLEDRQIGRVQEIRWRSTVLRTKNDDIVIIPNGLFAKGVITIFGKEGLENRRWVYFNVHLRHAPNQVQQVVLASLAGTPNLSTRTPPDCLLWRYHDSWAEYAVRYRLTDYGPDDPTDSEVRKRIWYALHRENIEIPYPGYNVFMTELNAARTQTKQERERMRRIELLGRVGILAPLDDHARLAVSDGLQHCVYGAGEVIIKAGDAGDSLFVIRSGSVGVRISGDGLEKEVATLGEGEFFGEMSLLTGEPRRATVVAKSDAECYVIKRASFQRILQENARLADEIGKLLSEREMKNKIEREGLSAEAARANTDHQALLTRIRSFFGLS
ncbi:MAG: Potassium efflux system KefA protein [Myxococcales bacterium]|nr:Potassium efflux system KefA protein [Myxococcales bacterium]